MSDYILKVENLSKYFPIYGGLFKKKVGDVKAVENVSFSITKGQTLGIVGESGCGKTTLGRTIVRLYEPSQGRIAFQDQDFTAIPSNQLIPFRKKMQMIFQDPYASLNPRMPIRKILEEPFKLHKIGTPSERIEKVLGLLEKVGLRKYALNRFPHEFSGGQRQRIGIARAIALNPDLIICDEPVSALDVSIQSQILNLLKDLQSEMSLTYIFISHDLSIVRYISDVIAVMYLGKIVEMAPCEQLFKAPQHPYTQALLSSVPIPNPRKKIHADLLKGEVPSPVNPPTGCYFHTRCKYVMAKCRKVDPEFKAIDKDNEHKVACHLMDM